MVGSNALNRTLGIQRLLFLVGVLALAACSTSAPTSSNSTGQLVVTITPPAIGAASVTVTGPSGYHTVLSSTQTLTGLAPGSYSLTAANTRTSAPVVSAIYAGAITGSPAAVTANGMANASVTYGVRSGSGGLWFEVLPTTPNTPTIVAEFTAAQIAANATPTPTVTISQPSGANDRPTFMAQDPAGNLWIADTNSITEYTAADLAATGSPAPAVRIRGAALMGTKGAGPQFFTFDAAGDLWVANNLTNNILKYTPAQLAAGGTPLPAVVVSVDPPDFTIVAGIAFDAAGNLWVTGIDNTYSIFVVGRLTSGQLATSGVAFPEREIKLPSTLATSVSVAFDTRGGLWVGTLGGTSPAALLGFTAASLASANTAQPAVTVALPGLTPEPWTIAFDNSGDLWVSDISGKVIEEFTLAQLGASGSPVAAVTLHLAGLPLGMAFDGTPAGLPIP